MYRHPLVLNIEKSTTSNENYRRVIYTGEFQVVLMSLLPREEIGLEVHEDNDQFIRVEEGDGITIIEDNVYQLYPGMTVIVPKGTSHNIINTNFVNSLKLYTIYSPPHHAYNALELYKN